MYFVIILFVVIISTIFAAFRIPNVSEKLKSKLPKLNLSRWVKNPKFKRILEDREFFREKREKLAVGALFIVFGRENYKIHDILFQPKELNSVNNFKDSEDAFAIIEHREAKFLFINSKLSDESYDKYYSRTRVLIERIAKVRHKNFIDGILIMPHADALKDLMAKPSKDLTDDIKYSTTIFQILESKLKVNIPLYFLGNRFGLSMTNGSNIFKNIFNQDPLRDNKPLYLGFRCDFSQKSDDIKLYPFFQNAMTAFMNAFNKKTVKILDTLSGYSRGLFGVHTIFNVQMDDFRLSQNYISHFLDYFDAYKNVEFHTITILNPVLFASFDGSTFNESVRNMFDYLAVNGKDRMVFSKRFLNSKYFKNALFLGWSVAFAIGGLIGAWQASHYLYKKRMAYVAEATPVYEKFATLFNSVLANKYPFSNPENNQNTNFDNVVYVFSEFQKILTSRNQYFFEHLDELINRSDAQLFINQLKTVKKFLLSQTDQNITAANFMIGARFEYRVNTQEEYLANRIVNWLLQIGDNKYGSQYGQLKKADFLWAYGNPLVFTIDFFGQSNKSYDANFSPRKTLGDAKIQGNSHMYVQGESVVFSYLSDAWSLLRFIQEHDVCPGLNIPCQKALLQFIIPLENRANAVLFCSLALQDLNGNDFVMPTFPRAAPVLSAAPSNMAQ